MKENKQWMPQSDKYLDDIASSLLKEEKKRRINEPTNVANMNSESGYQNTSQQNYNKASHQQKSSVNQTNLSAQYQPPQEDHTVRNSAITGAVASGIFCGTMEYIVTKDATVKDFIKGAATGAVIGGAVGGLTGVLYKGTKKLLKKIGN